MKDDDDRDKGECKRRETACEGGGTVGSSDSGSREAKDAGGGVEGRRVRIPFQVLPAYDRASEGRIDFVNYGHARSLLYHANKRDGGSPQDDSSTSGEHRSLLLTPSSSPEAASVDASRIPCPVYAFLCTNGDRELASICHCPKDGPCYCHSARCECSGDKVDSPGPDPGRERHKTACTCLDCIARYNAR